MKSVFIPVSYTGKVDLGKIPLENLPNKLGMVTTAQFQNATETIMQFLKEKGKEVLIDKQKQVHAGQLLGCDQGAALAVQEKVDAFLYIGSGRFHPLGVAMNTEKDVYCFNPVSHEFTRITQEDVGNYKRTKKVRYTKFLHAEKLGLLVSIKPGQYSYDQAVELKKKLEEKGKQAFIFVFDELQAYEMENFPFIDMWVNTACPRIADDPDKKNIIDMKDLEL